MTSLPRSINAVGKTKRRWNSYQAHSRLDVVRRCRGTCELCHCEGFRLNWHHAFGRRNIIAEPLASHPTMTTGLCDGCHQRVHAEPLSEENASVRRDALWRAGEEFGFEMHSFTDDLVGMARDVESMLREDGTWEKLREDAGLSAGAPCPEAPR